MKESETGRMGTVDMIRGSKNDLFVQNHPVIRLLREIPELVFADREPEITSEGISLKHLFTRKQMDQFHVDCLVIYQIAERVLHIMEELKKRHIFPGLYDLSDFYVNMKRGYTLWLLHPEKFQLLHFEQDFEWYPEDERIFGDVSLFDEKAQRKADTRLIYKVLTASTRGNVKIPPRMTETDYSQIFYKALPPEWKEIFDMPEGASHEEMDCLLKECIAFEKKCAKEAKSRMDEQMKREESKKAEILPKNDGSKSTKTKRPPFYVLFVILRTETENAKKISRFLYEEQDRLEIETNLTGRECHQAFVFGNGVIKVKEFMAYPGGFRCQMEQEIREYAAGEALLIGAELMGEKMAEQETGPTPEKPQRDKGEAGYRICVLTDGSLKNDRMFSCALWQFEKLKQAGCEVNFLFEKESQCEACQKLRVLAEGK